MTVTTMLNAPVAQPPTFNIPAAVPPNFDAAALTASLALGFGDRAGVIPPRFDSPISLPSAIVPVASFDCNAYGGCMGDQADGMGDAGGQGVGGGGTGGSGTDGGAGTDAGSGDAG